MSSGTGTGGGRWQGHVGAGGNGFSGEGRDGQEWNKTEGIELNINELNSIIKSNPLSKCNREFSEVIPIEPLKEITFNKFISTQEAFGKIMNEIGKVKNRTWYPKVA